MAMSVATLRKLSTETLTTAARGFTDVGGGISEVRDSFGSQVLGPLRAGVSWSGGGQQQASTRLAGLDRSLAAIPPVTWGATQIMGQWAGDLAVVQSKLKALDAAAEENGLSIVGSLVEAITDVDADREDDKRELQARLDALLAEAKEIDDSCARRLVALVETAGLPGVDVERLLSTSLLSRTPDGGGGGGFAPVPGAPPVGSGLRGLFGRLFRGSGPWSRPAAGKGWAGSGYNTEQLKANGNAIRPRDKEGMSHAARALSKHNPDAREGHEKFPRLRGNARSKNKIAKDVLSEILDNSGTKEVPCTSGKNAGGYYYIAPDGRGVAYNAKGEIVYFGVFDYPG